MKTALITGASGGIGREIVKNFIKNGYFVIAQYNKDQNSIKQLKEELVADNLSDYLFAFQCDFSDKISVEKFLDAVNFSFKHIDVLVNNAGIDYMGLSVDTSEEEFDRIMAVNFKSVFTMSNFALKSMTEKKSGKIINISSVWGICGASYETVYSASKSAIIGYTKALAKEVAPSNITVNCVCPGVIDTKMNGCFSKSEMKDIIADIPLNRLGNPKEIADVVSFLSSESANYITGQVITVDGGYISQ